MIPSVLSTNCCFSVGRTVMSALGKEGVVTGLPSSEVLARASDPFDGGSGLGGICSCLDGVKYGRRVVCGGFGRLVTGL